jgi:uncharacterized membrane protein (DUF4010 family)
VLSQLYAWLPPEGVKILLILFLSFLIGFEREEHKAPNERFSFGGVRTFPLIGLISYSIALLADGQALPVTIGFAVVGAFLLVSYRNKLATSGAAGVTTEMSALATYMVGALVYREQYWIATTICVACMLLLELKTGLEGLTARIAPEEILTFTKFLVLTCVILPVLPNQEFGSFQINPFKTWLVVVAVSAVSYGSYVLQRVTKGQGSILWGAILGGAYSSTLTTVVLSRRAAREPHPNLFSGAILIASGMMYLRLVALLAIFNRALMDKLILPFVILAGGAALLGWSWSRLPDPDSTAVKREYEPKNPLELRTAFGFALLFLVMLIATRLVGTYLGKAGVYTLAAIMGVTDVDPFIMGMTQSGGSSTPIDVAAAAILIAAASNNIVKGIYAYSIADRPTGIRSLCFLAGLGVVGLVPLLWLL